MDIKNPKTINPNDWYNIRELADKNLMPMLSSEYYIKQMIKSKRLVAFLIKGKKDSQVPTGNRYAIKGSNIIKFMAQFEDKSI